MELTDAIFTTLYIFAILMVVVLISSYVSFRIRKKREGNLEPYQKNIDLKEATVPKIKIKNQNSVRSTNEKTSVSRLNESTSLDSARKTEKEKSNQRSKAEERERQRSKEKLREARRKEKERAEKLAKERELNEKKKVHREDRIQVLNSLTPTNNNSESIENKIYSRPATPLRPTNSTNAGNQYQLKEDNESNNSIFNNYTDNENTNFYTPKVSYKGDNNKS